jgi:hypothetical protein
VAQTARPTELTNRPPANTTRPSQTTRVPATNRPAAGTQTVSNRPPVRAGTRPGPGLGLTDAQNQGLLGALAVIGGAAQGAIQAALVGDLLTEPQIQAIKDALANAPLTAPMQLGLIAALQADAQEKHQLQAAGAAAVAGLLGGAGGAGGALGGTGGALAGGSGGTGGALTGGSWSAGGISAGWSGEASQAELPVVGMPVGTPVAAQPVMPAAPSTVVPVAPSVGAPEPLAPLAAPARGVQVTELRNGWPAAAGGLRAGDVVVSVDGTPVASVADIRATLAGKQAVEITFRNCENGRMEFTRVYPQYGLIGLNGQTVPLDG